MVLMEVVLWMLLFAISISKPISDYFWLKKFQRIESQKHLLIRFIKLTFNSKKRLKAIFLGKVTNPYIINFSYILLLGAFATIYSQLAQLNLIEKVLFFGAVLVVLMVVSIVTIRSILVCCLYILCYCNFSFISIFLPFSEATDLPTLNSILTNLISILNFFLLIMTFAFGALWQFSRHIGEFEYGTISTVFYMFGYVSLNIIFTVIFLLYPVVKQIQSLAV